MDAYHFFFFGYECTWYNNLLIFHLDGSRRCIPGVIPDMLGVNNLAQGYHQGHKRGFRATSRFPRYFPRYLHRGRDNKTTIVQTVLFAICHLIHIYFTCVPDNTIKNKPAIVELMVRIWNNDGLIYWRIYASLDHEEFLPNSYVINWLHCRNDGKTLLIV